jgi:hypothetical protein
MKRILSYYIHYSIMSLFVEEKNQDERQNRAMVENLVGAEQLEHILCDIKGSAQALIDDVYAEDPQGETFTDRQPVKFLSAGDVTSENCVLWLHDPSSAEAYSVNVNFTFTKHRVISDEEAVQLEINAKREREDDICEDVPAAKEARTTF